MIALGIDPSLTRTALAARAISTRDRIESRARHWVITTDPKWPLEQRLRHLASNARRLADAVQPDVIAMEEPGFIQRAGAAQAAATIFRAQGAIIAAMPTTVPILIVPVHQWRRDLGIVMRRGAGKQPILDWCAAASIEIPTKTERGRVLDDDVADAYCVAEWALQSQAASL